MRSSLSVLVAMTLAFAACKDDAVTPAEPTVTIFSGDQQTAAPNATLPLPLTIRATNSDGDPLSGRTVEWTPVGGATVTPGQGVTDAEGKASTVVRLGTGGGSITVKAKIEGGNQVIFTINSTGPQPLIQLASTILVPVSGSFQHDTYVRDGIAFLCAWNSGVLIYDVGNGIRGGSPTNPQPISTIKTGFGSAGDVYAHNAWWFHNPVSGQNKYLFVGQEGPSTFGTGSSGDIHVVDVSNLSAPVEVATLSIPGAGVHNFWMDEERQILYAAYYNSGVIAVDVSGTLSGNISNRIVAHTVPGGPGNTYVWGVRLARNLLYISDLLNGFWSLDPVTLEVRGGGNNVLERYTSDLWTVGNVGYSGTWSNRSGRRGNILKIWDLLGAGPTLQDSLVVSGNVSTLSDVGATPDNKVLVVTAETGAGGGLYLYDLHDPFKPTLISSVTVSGGLHTGKISVINGRTYVFASKNPGNPAAPALMIYDITGAVNASTAQ